MRGSWGNSEYGNTGGWAITTASDILECTYVVKARLRTRRADNISRDTGDISRRP